jgi:rhodanese-related sulfurtransferase
MRKAKSSQLLVLTVLLASLLLTGCGGAETPAPTAVPPTTAPQPTKAPEPTAVPEPTPEPALIEEGSELAILANHISERLAEWTPTMSADDLYENLNDGDDSNDPFILSVRSAEHYALGHIPGAYNIPWKEIADPENLAMLPTDQQIVTYCYTGHTGQVAATLLRIFGYDAINLKFGMMGWTDDDDVLATARYAGAAGYPVETEANELTETYEPPVLETGEADAIAIAQARAQAFLADWTPTMSADDLYENLNDGDDSNTPFILSVRSAEHYALGHVPGAHNIPWKAIANPENLVKLPTDQQIVTYCYTGHTGQVAATSLALLGYDVTNLKFGMMGWTDDDEVLATSRYAGAPGYPTEGEAAGVDFLEAAGAYFGEGFQLITAEALYENLNDGDDSNDPYIIDIRKPEDYVIGHVPGAVNISGSALFSDETLTTLPTDGQFVVYCYTGQTAGQVVGALNTLGYDAYSLKFGMPSWAIAEGASRWNDDMSMAYPTDTEAVEMTGDNALPTPLGSAYEYFSEGFKLIGADALYENLNDGDDSNDPYILDIRSGDDYASGHVPGAVNVGGGALFNAETLAALPADGQVVVYCYTGQTAGQVVGVLNMLGYDAYSLKFGYPSWAIAEGASRWNDDMSMGYPVETGSAESSFLDGATAYFSEGFKLITADALYENLNDGDDSNDPVILDIRKAEDYAVGHVLGAVNISGGAIFSEETLAALPTDEQIVVYCYTGQTAGQVVGALNTLGYDAYSLKFGMPSWAIAEGASRWNDDMSMAYPADTEAVEMTGDNALPTPLGSAHEYFGEGFKLIGADALYENLNDGDDSNDPYIIDIRKAEDYAVGHVPGAVNVGGGALFDAETLDALPADGQVVVYCYTGQTAGQVVGVLNMLGYDAYSLKFGYPSWTTENASSGLWNDSISMGYPTDTEAHELP